MPSILPLQANQKQQPTNRNIKKRQRFYNLVFTICLLFSCFSSLVARADESDNDWKNIRQFWFVDDFNYTTGSFTIHVKAVESSIHYLSGYLYYSTDNGLTYQNFFYISYTTSGLQDVKAMDTSTTTYTNNKEPNDNGNIWYQVTLHINKGLAGITNFRIGGEGPFDPNETFWGDAHVASHRISGIISVTTPKMAPFTSTGYEFVTIPNKSSFTPKARINYTKQTLGGIDPYARLNLRSINTNTYTEGDTAVHTSGYIDVDPGSADSTYSFYEHAYGTRLTMTSDVIHVPAFTFPLTFSAAYNPGDSNVTCAWRITPVAQDAIDAKRYVKDGFVLQVADNPAFDNADQSTIPYDPSKDLYYFYITKNFAPHMYIRLARNHTGQNWNTWDVSSQRDLELPFPPVKPLGVSLVNNTDAQVKWQPSDTAWLPNATFIITRVNNTTKTQDEIRLTKSDFMLGQYTDKGLQTCNQYSYLLRVVPPASSAFTAYSPVPVQDTILPVQLGTIFNITASKGYFPGRVELRWSAKGHFNNFVVKRAVYPGNNFIQVATVNATAATDYAIDDANGTPGVYYNYIVMGVGTCNNSPIYSDTLSSIGFRSPAGNINGQVVFANGQGVGNVAVVAQNNDGTLLGQSIYFDGTNGSYLKIDSLKTPLADSAFTVEAWIKPGNTVPKSETIFSRTGQYKLGFNAAGKLYFSAYNQQITADYINPNNSFIHITAFHSNKLFKLMVNDSVVAAAPLNYSVTGNTNNAVYIGADDAGNNFKGNIDEVRLWNRALADTEAVNKYTRILTGAEQGLAAYWRFDETISGQFFDLAHTAAAYNQNDGKITGTAVHSPVIPTTSQLALKAYTDTSGNYTLQGLPYTGTGTVYAIAALLNGHVFTPAIVTKLIGDGSSQYTVDFTDKSSFTVSGQIYYRNSEVPVSGVMFKIDGQYAQNADGNIIESDGTGNFSINVPVGIHDVRAVKNNHVFVNSGRLVNRQGQNYNYQDNNFTGLKLYDSTTIRFIGRIAGGTIQQAYPLGRSLSTNNLGKKLTVTLGWPTAISYRYKLGTTDSVVTVKHLLPSDPQRQQTQHSSSVTFSEYNITISADSLTGEFAADIIPEKFSVSASATGWQGSIGGNVTLDFTNKLQPIDSSYTYKDSILKNSTDPSAGYNYATYTDVVTYNYSYKFIKRVAPAFSINQLGGAGNVLPYFGDTTFTYNSAAGKSAKVPVVTPGQPGRGQYLLNNPVFSQGTQYQFLVKAFEPYPYYNSDGGPAVTVDNVPTSDGQVSMFNAIKDGSGTDVLSLDSTGNALYTFTAGIPDFGPNGTKKFNASVAFGAAENTNWLWYGNKFMDAYVTGAQSTGVDFVTAGPNKILTVLRDPPGSRSYTYLENNSTFKSTTTYSGSYSSSTDESVTQLLGTSLVTFEGVGVAGVINSVETNNGVTFGVKAEESYTYGNTKVSETTLTTRLQTSSDPTFVGAAGDVFAGYSTNITYGSTNNLIVIDTADYNPGTDFFVDNSPAVGRYRLIHRTGINLAENFSTFFAYPQQHIEKVLIPNLVTIRNNQLYPKSLSDSAAQLKANSLKTLIYRSNLENNDPDFGRSNEDFSDTAINRGKSYSIFVPASPGKGFSLHDTILALNQYIDNWKAVLKKNEKDKLEAGLMQNYSFHGGNDIEFSKETNNTSTENHSFKIVVGLNFKGSDEFDINNFGFSFEINQQFSTEQGGDFEKETGATVKRGFVLSSDGTDDYFTVDVDTAKDGSFVYRLKGGASACPYEGPSVTTYYQPGTIIDQPTVHIEVPKISVDNNVAANVPATRPATFNLTLGNQSEAQLPATFILSYADGNVHGATIAVDGTPIGGAGRAVVVQYGQTVNMVLTLTKGPDSLNYNDILVILHSACQYDPTGYQAAIADTVHLFAHFVPSCSNVNVSAPGNNWVVNAAAETPINAKGNRYLPITINQFDLTNSLFNNISLQFKPSSAGDSRWQSLVSFYKDSAGLKTAQDSAQLITNAQAINFNFEMDDASFADQSYDIRAVSTCIAGPGSIIATPSNVVTGIKDTYAPRLFGVAQPANGILGIGDNVQLTFNEPIQGGILTNADFQVTGIRNNTISDHSVSISLDGQNDYLATEFDKNLTGKSLTAELWVLANADTAGTIFSHGNALNSLELAITKDHYIQVRLGDTVITSGKAIAYSQGVWAHVALKYNAVSKTLSVFYNTDEMLHNVYAGSYTGIGHFEFGRSISGQTGFFAGKIHEARIWTDTLSLLEITANSLAKLTGSEKNLMAYYPMNEGKGKITFDKANASNASITGSWSTPAGKAVSFNGAGYLKMSTGAAVITQDMDYTIQLWFKAQPGQTDATLASSGKGDGTDGGGSKNVFYLGFENGLFTFQNNGFKIQADGNYLDNNWHSATLTVSRTAGIGQLYIDDNLQKYFSANVLGGLSAAYTYLGARAFNDSNSISTTTFDRYFKGNIDELRIWNTYLNQTLVKNGDNVRLKGDELGLMAYYPFENYFINNNISELDSTLADLTIQTGRNIVPPAVITNGTVSNDMAPVKSTGPVSNLNFNYVTNDDALIINLLERKQDIDKTTVTFSVKNVRDKNNNTIQNPYTWTAYIDQDQLKWADNALEVSKEVNAPLQFQSYILNKGGKTLNYTIDNLPSWLSASPSGGQLAPLGKQTITFTVNASVNIGNYNETVYLHDDNNDLEALQISLVVNGKRPDWKVDTASYAYNMNVVGQLRINNIFATNPKDVLAVFNNGNCVGVSTNTYNNTNGLWYTLLTIYGNKPRYNNLEFRIWDASTGKTYAATPSALFGFVNDTIIGSSLSPVIFDGKEMILQNIALQKGWNWISLNVQNSTLTNVGATLSNGIWQAGDIVKNNDLGFDQYSSANGWLGYLPGFNNTSMYMVKSAAQTLSVAGTPVKVSDLAIPLKAKRWNYISYLPQQNLTIKQALAGYNASPNDVIKSQTGFAQYDAQLGWFGNLEYLEPGKGYMMYRSSASDTSFFYPKITSDSLMHRGGTINRLQAAVAGNFAYADNMTLIATTEQSFNTYTGDYVLAYIGDELRGKAVINNNGVTSSLLFFTIAGDNQLPVHFKLERQGKVIAVSDEAFNYVSNSTAGTINSPFVIHFVSDKVAINVHPNPFYNVVQVDVALPPDQPAGAHTVEATIYNVMGRLVFAGPATTVNTRNYYFTWNGIQAGGGQCAPGVYFVKVVVDGKVNVYKIVKIDH